MADSEGKLLPVPIVRTGRQSHHPHGSDGRTAELDPVSGWCGRGTRHLPSLWTEGTSRADGTRPPSSIGGLDLAGTRSGGQASSANRGWLDQVSGCWQIAT
jgi:hypothetical protein